MRHTKIIFKGLISKIFGEFFEFLAEFHSSEITPNPSPGGVYYIEFSVFIFFNNFRDLSLVVPRRFAIVYFVYYMRCSL